MRRNKWLIDFLVFRRLALLLSTYYRKHIEQSMSEQQKKVVNFPNRGLVQQWEAEVIDLLWLPKFGFL